MSKKSFKRNSINELESIREVGINVGLIETLSSLRKSRTRIYAFLRCGVFTISTFGSGK